MAKIHLDPDQPPERLVKALIELYTAAAKRLQEIVLAPTGRTQAAQEFRQSQAAQMLAEVNKTIAALKGQSAVRMAQALAGASIHGLSVADAALNAAGVRNPGSPLVGGFTGLDRELILTLMRDSLGDLGKAADEMQRNASSAIRHMAASGMTGGEVSKLIAGNLAGGMPKPAAFLLKKELEKVHGGQITLPTKKGGTITFDTGYYAEMVVRTQTREASVNAKISRFEDRGVKLVTIAGRITKNFCTNYVGKVYSIGGDHPKYPPLSSLPSGGPPFHPNCSKTIAPFIEDLASKVQREEGLPDTQRTGKVMTAAERVDAITAEILARAKANGYEPPPMPEKRNRARK